MKLICSKCQSLKDNPKFSYCAKCRSEYSKNYKRKKKSPNIVPSGLSDFVQYIKKSNYNVDFNDISNIIFFYSIITDDIHEFDNFKSGEQIKKMWDVILDYHQKKYINYETED